MRLKMDFILCLFCLLAFNANNVHSNKYDDNILENDELKLIELYQNKAFDFKKEFPLSLKEKNLSTITKETLKLHEYNVMKFFQWRNDMFVVAAKSNESSVFSLTFEEDNVVLNPVFTSEHSSFMEDIDIFKVIVNDDDLWIFEAQINGNVVKVIKINLNLVGTERVFAQLITHPFAIQDVFPFFGATMNLVLITNGNFSTVISIYSEEDDLLKKKSEYSYKGNLSIKSMFVSSGLYFAFIGQENTTIMAYDENFTNLKEIRRVDKSLIEVLIYEDKLSMSEFLAFVEVSKTEIYLLKNFKLYYWNRIFTEDEKIDKGHIFSYEYRNFIVYGNKENISVYTQRSYEEFSMQWKFPSCGDIKEMYTLSEGEIFFVIQCDNVTNFKRFEEEKESKDIEMQNDFPEDKSVEKCLNEMEKLMKENTFRIPEIKNTLRKKILLQTETSTVVNYEESSKENIYKSFIQNSKLGALSASVGDLTRKLDEMINKTNKIEDELKDLLTFEGAQHITAAINVNKMIANYSLILAIDLKKLNGRHLDEYKTNYMTFDEDQFVNTTTSFDKIMTTNINTKSLSTNGSTILAENLFDIEKHNQVVTGHHSFSSIEVKDSISEGDFKGIPEINGIDVKTLITKGSNVHFEDNATFSQLLKSEEELLIEYLNGVDYGAWSRSVLKSSRNPNLPFGGSVTIDGDVFVHGNVKATAINGIDFKDLYENAAKRSNQGHHIKDKVVFSNKLSVDNLEVEVVNDLKWKTLLRKRDDRVSASFNVDDGFVTNDLNSNSINGLDLDKEVMLSGPDQTLQGRITFVNDVEVKSAAGVTMETGATINAIDPSFHAHLGQSSDHQIFNKKLDLGEVLTVNGNLRLSTINHKPFPNFKNDYWSKSRPQRIPHSVTIRKANFRNSFYTSTLNGTRIKDFLLTNIPQTISADNFFLSDVLVSGNIYMENNKTVDKVDVSLLKENAMSLHEQQYINSLNEFTDGINVKHFLTKGGYLNGLNVEDFITAPFQLSNNVIFKGAVEAHSLHAVDLNIDQINEMEALKSIIKEKTPLSEIEGNLFAKKLKVNELSFTKTLNGKDFNIWYKKVARKTKPIQDFQKSLTVLGDVIFNGSIDIDILNSKQLNSFLNKIVVDCERCAVHGKKVFLKPIEVQGNLSADFINGVNLNELKERLLSKTKEQTIKGKYKFNSGLTAKTVHVDELSGIPINEIVLTNNINVPYTMNFENDVWFDKIYSKEGWIDGCQVSQVFNPPNTQIHDLVFSNVTFGNLDLKGDVTLGGKAFLPFINTDVMSFLDSIVSKTGDQTILGSTLFQSQSTVQSLKTDSVNKYSYEEFINKLRKVQTVVKTNCDITFENLFANKIISEDVSAETVNGLSLKQIEDFGVRKDYRGIIKGTKRFHNVLVRGNLKTEKINGTNFEDLVKIKGANKNLKIVFTAPLYFKENLNVQGKIAEEEPSILFRHFRNGDSSSSLPFPLHYDKLIVEGDLIVNTINGLNLSDIVLKSDNFPFITGKKNFIGGIFVGGESRIGTLNGLDLNQFKDWSYIFTDVKPERYSYGKSRENSFTQNKVLLSHEAFDVTRINEINLKISKGLHQKLFSISVEDRIQPSGNQIRALRKGHSKNFNIFVQYNPCLSWSLCPCFETYSMKINNSKLLVDNELVKGLNIQIVDEENYKFFNFIIRCSADQISTTVIEVHKSKDFLEPIVVTKTENFGLVLDVLHFHINGNSYFIMATLEERNLVLIKTLNINFETVWEEKFIAELSKVQVEMIHGNCYLLVVSEEPHNKNHAAFERTKLYLWNSFKESFVLVSSFPLAVTGDLVSFGHNSYLVLGFDGKTEKNFMNSGSDLQVYRSSGKSLFSPFTSLPVFGVCSSVFFTVDNDLYLAVASVTQNSVSIFRMINQEGFAIQESFYVVNPSEMHYINVHNQHYLLISEYKTNIVLLKLNFKGASFR